MELRELLHRDVDVVTERGLRQAIRSGASGGDSALRDPRERLHHVLEAINHIERYASRGREAFEADELIQSWIVRHLQMTEAGDRGAARSARWLTGTTVSASSGAARRPGDRIGRTPPPDQEAALAMAEERLNLPFTGLVSFMRAPAFTDFTRLDADIAILGAPTDEGSPWKPGSRFAPRKIRELSVQYAGYGPTQNQKGYYDIEEDRRYLEYERQHNRIVDCGDSDIVYTNVRRTFDNITQDVRRILRAGAFPVVLGGDHAVTYPVVRAYDERLNVVHFDAHLDYRPFVHGVQWANGNPIRNVAQLKTCHHIIQVGIRSLRTSQSDVADSRARGNDIVTVPELRSGAAPRPSSTACPRTSRSTCRSTSTCWTCPWCRAARPRSRTGSPTTSCGRRYSRSPGAAR